MVVNCIKWHVIVYLMEKLWRIQCVKCSSLSQNLFWILSQLVTSCPVRRTTEDSTLCYTMSCAWPKVMRMLKSIEVIKPDLLPNHTYVIDGWIVVFEYKLICKRDCKNMLRTKKHWALWVPWVPTLSVFWKIHDHFLEVSLVSNSLIEMCANTFID